MTLLYSDPLFLAHETGQHPERPQRIVAAADALRQAGLWGRCTPADFAPLGVEEVQGVHSPDVLARAAALCAAGGGHLEADTPVCPASLGVALAAAGACCDAASAVLAGRDRTAFCLVRPPGHHATPGRSMGFCLVNSIALAARRALAAGVGRVLVVDWDVHHGNGTQDVFYDDGRVTFLSAHRFGPFFYPGTGRADETGTGPGLGHTFNVPLPEGTSRPAYHAAFRAALHAAAEKSRPELVLLSAGFDGHRLDPIGRLGLEVEDYVTLSREVLAVAQAHAGGRLVSCLEGGYNLGVLGECVAAHVGELLGA